jgi:hypothetical protein
MAATREQRDAAERDAYYDLLGTLAGRALDIGTGARSGTTRQAAAIGLALQFNQYGFWIRQRWVDPLAVSAVLLNGRREGMLLPGDPEWSSRFPPPRLGGTDRL